MHFLDVELCLLFVIGFAVLCYLQNRREAKENKKNAHLQTKRPQTRP